MNAAARVMELPPLAHSAPKNDPGRPQPYGEHVANTLAGAAACVDAMLAFAGPGIDRDRVRRSIITAVAYHDLGKLDETNQSSFRKGREARLWIDHIDAGVAHTFMNGDKFAAWLVRGHHAPGLPSMADEVVKSMVSQVPLLRGVRRRSCETDDERKRHLALIQLTDARRDHYAACHRANALSPPVSAASPVHGLTMRLALSCLVNADHADSARHDTRRELPIPLPGRWEERICSLDRYVTGLPKRDPVRDKQRSLLYDACKHARHDDPIVSCQAPVGSGKTFAVTRYLLAKAYAHKPAPLRRLFVIAPYTSILTQTARRLREALVLPDEPDPTAIVAEHHHRADFGDSLDLRDLATLWRAPIVVTTAVQFFETIAACNPTDLRKLHELPGSAIFIDEAHSCIPVHHWPQQWRWLRELAQDWSCAVVLASGSMVRFWESEAVITPPAQLPELTPRQILDTMHQSEKLRVRIEQCRPGDQSRSCLNRGELIEALARRTRTHGPTLCVLNTVQTAAVIARDLARKLGEANAHQPSLDRTTLRDRKVLHLSTALTPHDREAIVDEIERRQSNGPDDWALVDDVDRRGRC